jgi:DNA invertase Pin-like site-specific DNA recombinase
VHDRVFMSLPVHPLAGQRVGYARISSASQNLDGQTDALTAAGCEKIFTDTASGKLAERPELTLCLGYLRAGDTLAVWWLDRLGRSLRHLVETVNALADRGVAFASLHEGIDTTTSTGRLRRRQDRQPRRDQKETPQAEGLNNKLRRRRAVVR